MVDQYKRSIKELPRELQLFWEFGWWSGANAATAVTYYLNNNPFRLMDLLRNSRTPGKPTLKYPKATPKGEGKKKREESTVGPDETDEAPQDSGSIWGNDWQKLRYQGVSLSPCALKILGDVFEGSKLSVKDLRVRVGVPQLIKDFSTIEPGAVTIGNDIYIEASALDRFDVRTSAGMALLAHEAWHALQYANGMTKTEYLRESERQWWNNKRAYEDNKYEVEASEAEEVIRNYINDTYGDRPCDELGLSSVAR